METQTQNADINKVETSRKVSKLATLKQLNGCINKLEEINQENKEIGTAAEMKMLKELSNKLKNVVVGEL